MKYIRVLWLQRDTEYPVELLSELDDDSWEVRKVERFADGRVGLAGSGYPEGLSGLGEAPVPPIEEIAADPEFVPEVIDREEFERAWEAARQGVGFRVPQPTR